VGDTEDLNRTPNMTVEMLGRSLNGKLRPDGSTYFTCPDLRGFHIIVAEGEEPESVLRPAMEQFVRLYRAAERKNAQ
jgi:hypothetical protein